MAVTTAGETAVFPRWSNAARQSAATADTATRIRFTALPKIRPTATDPTGDPIFGGAHANILCDCVDGSVAACLPRGTGQRAKLSLVRSIERAGWSAKLRIRELGAMHGDRPRHRRLLRTEFHVP